MSTVSPEVPLEGVLAPRRAFVVVGMHRSGTSAMTRTLSLLGASLPRQLMPAVDNNNEAGFWEPRAIADLNDEILQAQDSNWDDVFAFRPRHYLSNFDRFYAGRAAELLEQEFNGSEVIVLKDPRISVLTSFWDRTLSSAGYSTHYVIMVRNPLEVAESLRARDGFPREKSLLLWSSYMVAAERDTRDRDRIFVSYDQLLSDWRSVRRRIETGTGVPFPRDTAAAAIEIDRFLDRRMHHHEVGSKDLFSRADVPEQVKTLYRIFSEACEGVDVDREALRSIEAELEELDLLVGPLLADLRASARALSGQVVELADAHEGARGRVDLLEEQLAAERALWEAEAATTAQSNADFEARLAELAQRITATEAERDTLAVAAEDKARRAAELAEQLAATEAEVAANEDKLAQRLQEVARLTELLKKSEQEIGVIKRDAQEARKSADAAAKASDDKLAKRFQELAALTEALKKSEGEIEVIKRDAEDVRTKAEAAARANEGKLAQRFQEMAALSDLLRRQEERAQQADEHVSWLLALNERLGKQASWWGLLPKSWARQRSLRRLRNAGLFDSDAYLQRYPDVAAARKDPLDHYLQHGYYEGRSRES